MTILTLHGACSQDKHLLMDWNTETDEYSLVVNDCAQSDAGTYTVRAEDSQGCVER